MGTPGDVFKSPCRGLNFNLDAQNSEDFDNFGWYDNKQICIVYNWTNKMG